ncbi:MAG TPA: FtsX-like permease family protein [Arenimonas sp.]|uniref:ABC transporter permease n=1 Tax=Arenimonas sp. TaxID=1872635 RepID=UPI002BE8B1CA|nr:FtsX-like permease family protein [Arenimonas sp.]HMB56129.1 FtsX-like permease family protein [Arenimonas sp.]
MEIRPILSSLLRNKTGALLIAAQVALSLAIVANALYIIHDRLERAARTSGVADETSMFRLGVAQMKDPESAEGKLAVQDRNYDLIRGVPGVASVARTNQSPLSRSGWNMGLSLDTKQAETTTNTAMYFGQDSMVKTFGLKLIEGRDFVADDVETIDPDKTQSLGRTAILTQVLAKKLFPASSAVGKTIYLGTGSDAFPLQVVGVVEKLQTPWANVGERGEISTILAARRVESYGMFVVRAEPGQRDRVMKDVEAALGKVPGQVVMGTESMEKDRIDLYRDDRAIAWMLITVTVLLLLVTASGIVGMATLWVNQRRKQIGVRRALGARRIDILRYFITENLMITTGGIVAGLLLAVALNQLLVSQLELPKLPLGYLAIGSTVLWLIGVLAVYGPAWRASSISPAIATRSA